MDYMQEAFELHALTVKTKTCTSKEIQRQQFGIKNLTSISIYMTDNLQEAYISTLPLLTRLVEWLHRQYRVHLWSRLRYLPCTEIWKGGSIPFSDEVIVGCSGRVPQAHVACPGESAIH